MSVEILTVSLSDESIEKIAQRVAQLWNVSNVPATQSNPPSSETHRTRSDQNVSQGGDAWGAEPVDDGGWPAGTTTAPPQQNQQQQQRQNPGSPTCAHGEMRFVPAGFSQSSGKSYKAFWACPTPRGAADKCKSITAA